MGHAPRLLTRSAFVMPTPESRMVSVLLVLSGCMWMNSSGSDSSTLLSVSDWNRTWRACAERCQRVLNASLTTNYQTRHTLTCAPVSDLNQNQRRNRNGQRNLLECI